MFCADILKNDLVCVLRKGAQVIPTEAINLVCCSNLVPKLFESKRCFRITIQP